MQQDAVSGFSTAQLEFLAEEELITVVPNIRLPILEFISGPVGPLEPGFPCRVPIWLAIMLRKRQLCKIQTPAWLDLQYLNAKKASESAENLFQELPFHYIEIHSLLINESPEDLKDSAETRLVLEDIINARQRKFRSGLRSMGAQQEAVKLTNASAVELNTIRPFLITTMNQFTEMRKAEEAMEQKSAEPEAEDNNVRQIRKRRKN